MTKFKSFALALLATIAVASASAQTNAPVASTNPPTTFDKIIDLIGGGVTNISVDPYITYAPDAPQKVGGGIFAAYNINSYVGLGIGLDWLGSFSLVSGDVELKAPFHVTSVFPSLSKYAFFQNFEITPFAIGGVATPYSGDGNFNGSPMVVSDAGAFFEFGHVLGGRFDAGGAYGAWSGSGPYAVKRYHAFAGLTWGF